MDQQTYQLNLLFEIPFVQVVFRQNQKQNNVIQQGNLGVYEIQQLNLHILKVNDWQYTLNTEIPIMKEQHKTFINHIYVMPTEGGQFGVILPGQTDMQLINCLEAVLDKNANLVAPDQVLMAKEAQEKGLLSEDEKKLNSGKVGAFIHLGGDYIRSGLIQGAKYVSQGIKKGGQFLQTKITKPEKKEVDPKTLQKVRGAKTASAIMLQYTKSQVTALYNALKQAAVATGQELEQTETGVKIKQHKNYDDAKNVGKGAVHALAAVYDGLFEALCEIGRGTGEATVGLVDAKYGGQAAEVAQEGVGMVGNVGHIVKAPGDIVRKDIVQETDNQKYNGINPQLK